MHMDMEAILIKIFTLLNKILVPVRAFKQDPNETEGNGTFWERIVDLIESKKPSLLFQLLMKLAWGDSDLPMHEDENSIHGQIFVALECIEGARSPRNSKFRRILTQAMSILFVTKQMELLKKLRLCYDSKNERKREKKKAFSLRERLKKIVFDPYCFPILLYDNLGFRNRQGFRKGLGYVQFTILMIVIISYDQLKQIGVYGENCLSRISKKWESIRGKKEEGGDYETVLAPNESDLKLFTENTMKIYASIMEAESQGIFPSKEKCKEMLQQDIFRQGEIPSTWFCPEYRGRAQEEESHDGLEEVHYDLPMQQDLNKTTTVVNILMYFMCIVKNMTAIFDPNILSEEIPITRDIPAAVCGDGSPTHQGQNWLRRTGRRFRGKVKPFFGGFHLVLELFKKRGSLFEHTHLRNIYSMTRESTKAQDFVLCPSNPNQPDAEGIGHHVGFFLSALRALIDMKREGISYLDEIKQDIELSYDTNDDDYDEDDSSSCLVESSDDSLEFSDGDYEVLEEELFDIESEDEREMSEQKYESDDEDNSYESSSSQESPSISSSQTSTYTNNIDVEITVEEFVKFIIARCKHFPTTFIQLLDMRFFELICMLHRSESNADSALYVAALKYTMVICSCTNATGYVEMICNIAIDLQTMSPAERAIYENFILFQKTKNGKNIFADRYVEWVMKDIREVCGKWFNDHLPSKLNSMMLQLKEWKSLQGRDKKDENDTTSKTSQIKIDASLLEAYIFHESANTWRGVPLKVKPKPYRKRVDRNGVEEKEPLGTPDFFYSTNGMRLYHDILSTMSRGLADSAQYFNMHHVEGDIHSTVRSQKEGVGVNLKMVNVTDEKLQKEKQYGLSLDIEMLAGKKGNIYNIPRLEQELNLLNEKIVECKGTNAKVKPQKIDGKLNKRCWAIALVNARKKVKEIYADAGESWEEEEMHHIEERFSLSQQTALDIIRSEMEKHAFLSFEGNLDSELAKQLFTFKFNNPAQLQSKDEERQYLFSEMYRSFARLN